MAAKNDFGSVISGVLSGALAGGIFLVSTLVGLPFVPALVAGVGAFIAGLFLFRPKSEGGMSFVSAGVTQQAIFEAIRDGRSKLAEMRSLAARITNPMVQFKVKQISDITEKILNDIRQDPKDLKPARQFLNYYLDATINILSRYVDLYGKKSTSVEVQMSLKKVEALLDTIRQAFEKQHAILLQDDVMDLDTELQVLEKTINLEGLGQER